VTGLEQPEVCGDRFCEFVCTRAPGHPLPHISDGRPGSGGLAVWPTFIRKEGNNHGSISQHSITP
jgi:hypothetical protein